MGIILFYVVVLEFSLFYIVVDYFTVLSYSFIVFIDSDHCSLP